MTHIFYLFTIVFLYKELQWILDPKLKVEKIKQMDVFYKEYKGKKWDTYSQEYKDLLTGKTPMLMIMVWMAVGLFTAQWALFLVIWLFNIVIMMPLSRLTKYSIAYIALHWINSIIGVAFGVFIIINHYHLHIDTTKLIENLLT